MSIFGGSNPAGASSSAGGAGLFGPRPTAAPLFGQGTSTTAPTNPPASGGSIFAPASTNPPPSNPAPSGSSLFAPAASNPAPTTSFSPNPANPTNPPAANPSSGGLFAPSSTNPLAPATGTATNPLAPAPASNPASSLSFGPSASNPGISALSAATNPPPPSAPAAPLPPAKFPSETLSSTQYILSQLHIGLTKRSENDIQKILKNPLVVDKLQKGIAYYDIQKAKAGSNDYLSSLYDDIEKQECNSWTETKDRISPLIKNQVVALLMQQTNLPAKVAFELIDLYFVSKKGQLYFFKELETKIKEMEQMLNDPQRLLNLGTTQAEVYKKYERYRKELDKHTQSIVKETREFYMKERKALLKLYDLIISNGQRCAGQNGMINTLNNRLENVRQVFRDTTEKLLLPKCMLMLISWLNRNLDWRKEFKDMDDEFSKITLRNLLQEEQIEVLKLLFVLYFTNQPAETQEILNFQILYLEKTNFQETCDPFRVGSGLNQEFVDRKILIEGLGQLTAICQLQLHQSDKHSDKLRKIILETKVGEGNLYERILDTDYLNNISAPVYLAIVRMMPQNIKPELTKNFYCEIVDKAPVFHLQQLLETGLFSLESMKNLQDKFYIVLKDWLNLIHEFLDMKNQDREAKSAEKMGVNLLKNRQIIDEVWQDIAIDENGSIKPVSSLAVFKDVLESPTLNLNKFLVLSEALCGSKEYPHCQKMFELLLRFKVHNHSLLNELYLFVQRMLEQLESQKIDQGDFFAFTSSLNLICKMIEQDPLMFNLLDMQFQNFQAKRQQQQFYGTNLVDLLNLLFHAMFQLLQTTNFEYSKPVVQHILAAIASTFENNIDLQPAIIDLFERFRESPQDLCLIIHFFNEQILNKEAEMNDFSLTQVFLKLLCKIFKKQNPLDCLNRSQQNQDIHLIKLDTSFLYQSLQHVYVPLMKHYFSLKFKSTNSLGHLTARLLKLGRILLSKFNDIPNQQKQMLFEPLPRNDQLLECLSSILNNVNLHKVSMAALSLVEVQRGFVQIDKFGNNSNLENRFLQEALVGAQNGQNTTSSAQSRTSQTKKIKLMVNEALNVLNMMVQLCQIVSPDSKEEEGKVNNSKTIYSKKSYFISNKLSCIQTFKQQILDPSKADTPNIVSHSGATLSQTLFSMIAHYITPSIFIDRSDMKIQALSFLTNCCLLWENHCTSMRKPELFSLLIDNLTPMNIFRDRLSNKFIQVMTDFSPNSGFTEKKTLIAMLEFLSVTTHSQPRFVETIFRNKNHDGEGCDTKELTDVICTLLNKTENLLENADWITIELIKTIRFKFVILFSLMAKKNICLDLLEFENHKIIVALYENIISKQWFTHLLYDQQKIDATLLKPVVQEMHNDNAGFGEIDEDVDQQNHVKISQVVTSCHAKITLCYYIDLIASQYHRKKFQSDKMGQLVNLLFNSLSGDFAKKMSLKNRFKNFEKLSFQVSAANNWLKTSQNPDDDQIRQLALEYLSKSQVQFETSHLTSSNNSIYFEGILHTDLLKCLKDVPSMTLILDSNRPVTSAQRQFQQKAGYIPGNLGSEFLISVSNELEPTMTTQVTNYDDYCMRAQCSQIFKEFNLACSENYVDMLLFDTKRDFMTKIGNCVLNAFQQNGSHQNGEQLARESLLPLVGSIKQIRACQGNPNSLKREVQTLTNKLIDMAKVLLNGDLSNLTKKDDLVFSKEQRDGLLTSIYVKKMNETILHNFSFTLGAINTLLGNPGANKDHQLQLQTLLVEDLIPELPQMFQDEDLAKNDQSYNFFTQITLQSFQILRKIENKGSQDWQQRINSLELALNVILAKVIEGMRQGFRLDRSLKIIQLVICEKNLMFNDQQVQKFMHKQNSQALRVLIERLFNTQATKEEQHDVVQLLIDYASSEHGADHLQEVQILQIFNQSNCLKNVSEQSMYGHGSEKVNGQQIQIRNPNHTLWCQLLLLFQTLNQTLISTLGHSQITPYLESAIDLMKVLQFRFREIMEVGVNLNKSAQNQVFQQANKGVVSIALLEELELQTSILNQLFQHAPQWAQRNFESYSMYKDLMMFAVPHLIANLDPSSVMPASYVEDHLAQLTQERLDGRSNDAVFDKNNALRLKIDISMSKIYFNMVFALHALIMSTVGNDNDPNNRDLVVTWGQLSYQNEPQSFYEKVYSKIHPTRELPIKVAYELMLRAQKQMTKCLEFSENPKNKSQQLSKYLINLFTNNEMVQNEYAGGLNLVVIAPFDELTENGPQELQEMTQCAIGAGEQVTCMLLEKLRAALGDALQQPEMYYSYAPNDGTSGGSRRYFEGTGARNIEQSAKLLEMSIKEKEKIRSMVKDKEFMGELNKCVASVRQNPSRYDQY